MGEYIFLKKNFLNIFPMVKVHENEVLPNLILRKKISGKIFKNFL